MATKNDPAPETQPLRVPPEERYWKRYSPHGEAPLSFAGSFAVHLIFGGLFLLVGLSAFALADSRNVPVDPVRLPDELGGGGGHKRGKGPGPGIGKPQDDVGSKDDRTEEGEEDGVEAPPLKDAQKIEIQKQFTDKADARFILDSKRPATRAFVKLNEELRGKLRPTGPVPGLGKGGTGKDGGRGSGEGKGDGPGKGEGKGKLTAREKRMLRWHMGFTARGGAEYISQLRGLGAFLAFPVGGQLKTVRTLGPGARLLDEDVRKINSIYWIDDSPRGPGDVLAALGLTVRPVPDRFIAFMPGSLEKRLFEMERNYVTKVLRQPFNEDKIGETRFKVVFKGGRWQPELVSVTLQD
jgi:hypothetical protein